MPLEYLVWLPLATASLALYLTLGAGALFSVANSRWASVAVRRIWAAAIVLLPVVGAVLWLAASHRHNISSRTSSRTSGRHDIPSADDAAAPAPSLSGATDHGEDDLRFR